MLIRKEKGKKIRQQLYKPISQNDEGRERRRRRKGRDKGKEGKRREGKRKRMKRGNLANTATRDKR